MEKKPAMLIVDDVEINRVILAQFFEEEYEIFEASNGKEALDVLDNNKVDIVLLDMVMPVMDGFELMEVMKSDDKYAGIPVIVTTARNEGETEVRAMEMGAVDFITKPYNPTIVRGWVNNVMARLKNEWKRIERAVQQQQMLDLQHVVELDPLTGLYNRETFSVKAEAFLQEHQDKEYDILFLDINCFRKINDLFHTETGNLVLKTAAAYFRAFVGADGICGRMDSDKFVVCAPRDRLNMELFFQGLDTAMNSLHVYHNILFYAGIYPVDNVYMSVMQMCDMAHIALGTIKGKYNQRYALYNESMKEAILEEQMILREMDGALRSNQFRIYMQPVYSLKEQRMVNAEVLVRWIHPKKGMISPGKFIPAFEKNGFIVRLDRFVWEEACKFLKEQKEKYGRKLALSVNVSRINFYDPKLVEFILGLLRKYDIDHDMLMLEVTETAYTDNPQQLLETMRRLQDNGIKILMDDFGSGYSSLNMLKNVPADILKVDMKFVQDVENSKRAAAIMKNIVRMAEDIDMGVVIEGVETEAQVNFLKEIGCDKIQGFYFSKPLPKESYENMLKREENK